MSLGVTNVNSIASVAGEFIYQLIIKAFRYLILEPKSIRHFNRRHLMSFLQVRNFSISCLFTWGDIFPKNSKDTIISFLVELSFSFFLSINNLSKNFLMHLLMKNNGKEFFCHTDFKNKIC